MPAFSDLRPVSESALSSCSLSFIFDGFTEVNFTISNIVKLRNDVVEHVSIDVRQAVIATGVEVGELLMVEAHLMEDGGVEVVDVSLVRFDMKTEFIGRSMDGAAFDSPTRHPCREGRGMVVAASGSDRSATKFAGPNDEGFIEESALFEIFKQAGDRLVGLGAKFLVPLVVVAVGVPIGMVELHESRSPFHKASCQKAALSELVGFLAADAVEFLGRFGFVGSGDHIGRMGLHPVCQFVGFDPGGEFGVWRERVEVVGIELAEEVELHSLAFAAGTVRRFEIGHRVACSLEDRALISRRHES